MSGGSRVNNPNSIMMIRSRMAVSKEFKLRTLGTVDNRKVMDVGPCPSFRETLCHGSHVHLYILQNMPRMQA